MTELEVRGELQKIIKIWGELTFLRLYYPLAGTGYSRPASAAVGGGGAYGERRGSSSRASGSVAA